MLSHKDDFLPFVELKDGTSYEEYCASVADTAIWAGHVEVRSFVPKWYIIFAIADSGAFESIQEICDDISGRIWSSTNWHRIHRIGPGFAILSQKWVRTWRALQCTSKEPVWKRLKIYRCNLSEISMFITYVWFLFSYRLGECCAFCKKLYCNGFWGFCELNAANLFKTIGDNAKDEYLYTRFLNNESFRKVWATRISSDAIFAKVRNNEQDNLIYSVCRSPVDTCKYRFSTAWAPYARELTLIPMWKWHLIQALTTI